jgi:hypothetical protein
MKFGILSSGCCSVIGFDLPKGASGQKDEKRKTHTCSEEESEVKVFLGRPISKNTIKGFTGANRACNPDAIVSELARAYLSHCLLCQCRQSLMHKECNIPEREPM